MFFFLMIRRPPRSTRTDTLFPYTTLFRSCAALPSFRFGESLGCGIQRADDLVIAVARRDETGLECRGGQINAAFQHRVEETFEAFGVTAHHVGVAGDVFGIVEVQAEHAADLRGRERDAGGACAFAQAGET